MTKYACSDLHGNLNLYKQIINFLKPEDKLYILGDCGDRKPDGWSIIKDALCNTQIIYLKGNHEQLLVDAMRDYLQFDIMDYTWYLLCSNGGASTFQGWLNDGAKSDWMGLLDRLPQEAHYINKAGYHIVMSHAGFTPKGAEPHRKDDLLWDRKHFSEPWPDNPFYNKFIIVHGHTPCSHMVDKAINPWSEDPNLYLRYADSHKINLDCGTASSNQIGLLDLDTFHVYKFESTED